MLLSLSLARMHKNSYHIEGRWQQCTQALQHLKALLSLMQVAQQLGFQLRKMESKKP